ncbi:hypothetical protein NX80_012515 [Xanthomonas vasicola pv. arecae]|nr:hypothetical protein NX80_012515 [Xanthomonas vasicola pv. arecae]
MGCCDSVTRPGAPMRAWIARARIRMWDIDEPAGDGLHTKMSTAWHDRPSSFSRRVGTSISRVARVAACRY